MTTIQKGSLYSVAVVSIGLVAWVVWGYSFVRNIEEPSYTVLKKKTGYEIRSYKPYIVAETEVSGTFNSATREGFMRIFHYITGKTARKPQSP